MGSRKFSRKREAVLTSLKSTKSHPTAEWIYHELKSDYPEISLATVYRNLKVLQDSGEIISLGSIGGQERFDGQTMRHDHFICEPCGAVIDVPAPTSGELHLQYTQLAPEIGAVVSSHHVSYYGECKKCTADAASAKKKG